MNLKTPGTTLTEPEANNPAAQIAVAGDPAAVWKEARAAYPLYAALAQQFELAPAPYPGGGLPPVRPTRQSFERDLQWMALIDADILAYQIRQLPPETLNGNEASLRAFLHRQLRKPEKTTADRDKIDLLLVQYFALCAPEELYRKPISLADVARVLRPALPEAEATPVEWCAPLDEILEKLSRCHSLRDILEGGLLEQGRMLKDAAGPMFYDPAALVAFCRFNFVLRRTFIHLLHADLAAAMEAVIALEAKGIKTADCRRAGFSAAETTIHLRHFCENWRQPFHKDYTQSSVMHAFEQLLALRADLEDAVAPKKPVPAAPKSAPVGAAAHSAPAAAAHHDHTPELPLVSADDAQALASEFAQSRKVHVEEPEHVPAPAAPSAPAPASAPAPRAAATPAMDADKCMEEIWEQLIAAPPSRGRSMSTVSLRDTKVLLSSWEVAAFVDKGGQESEDLRRAVVARALVSLGTDQRKRSGDQSALSSALELARSEFSYFQGRVEQAKQAKKTEAAVNLGISTKRLLSFIEEAEKLQP
jgi:hypothetical protein